MMSLHQELSSILISHSQYQVVLTVDSQANPVWLNLTAAVSLSIPAPLNLITTAVSRVTGPMGALNISATLR